MSGWRAHLDVDAPELFARRLARLLVVRDLFDGSQDHLCADGTVYRLTSAGAVLPENVGILLPADAVEAVAAVFAPHAPQAGELKSLREELERERARVDRVLESALTLAEVRARRGGVDGR